MCLARTTRCWCIAVSDRVVIADTVCVLLALHAASVSLSDRVVIADTVCVLLTLHAARVSLCLIEL